MLSIKLYLFSFDDIPVQKHMNRGWIKPVSIPGISRG